MRPAMTKFLQKLCIMCDEELTVTSKEIFKFKTYSVIYRPKTCSEQVQKYSCNIIFNWNYFIIFFKQRRHTNVIHLRQLSEHIHIPTSCLKILCKISSTKYFVSRRFSSNYYAFKTPIMYEHFVYNYCAP